MTSGTPCGYGHLAVNDSVNDSYGNVTITIQFWSWLYNTAAIAIFFHKAVGSHFSRLLFKWAYFVETLS